MKKFMLIALLALSLFSATAQAVSTSATPIRVIASATNVPGSGGSWLVLDATTLKSVAEIEIASTLQDAAGLAHDIQIGITNSSAGVNTEVAQLYVPSASATTLKSIPMSTSGQIRISVLDADTNVLTKGELLLNLVYY